MNRRIFIKNTAAAALLPYVLNTLAACGTGGAKKGKPILVLIQLVGGNDGLNTLIPLDNYSKLRDARPNLIIPENKILPIKGQTNLGLHPAMPEIQEMFSNNQIGFIQGVGYENPSYSHFRSSDIWLTGSEANKVLYTGWMARYLETKFKNYPTGFPSATQPHPPAIKIGDTGTYLFQGGAMDMSIVIDPNMAFEAPEVDAEEKEMLTMAGREIKTIREILLQTERYSSVIKAGLAGEMNHSNLYPKQGENSLADQLKVVAKLIKNGMDTSVYLVDLKGFDTHDAQADPSNPTQGTHADLLKKLSQAVNCFWDDIVAIGREDDVMGITFSEFGRRIMSNSGNGTDHGSSQPIIYFGNAVRNPIIGHNPVIPNNLSHTDNLEMQYDYRAVFSSMLKSWLGCPPDVLKAVFGQEFPEILHL